MISPSTIETAVVRHRMVAVLGASSADPDLYELARSVGRRLARAGLVVVTGGLYGVMEGASRGAVEAGGETIGVLPGTDPNAANPWVTLPLPTGLGDGRNAIVATAGIGAIAVGGEAGTLSEIALALKRGLPVAALRSWELGEGRLLPDRRFLATDAADEAVRFVLGHSPGGTDA